MANPRRKPVRLYGARCTKIASTVVIVALCSILYYLVFAGSAIHTDEEMLSLILYAPKTDGSQSMRNTHSTKKHTTTTTPTPTTPTTIGITSSLMKTITKLVVLLTLNKAKPTTINEPAKTTAKTAPVAKKKELIANELDVHNFIPTPIDKDPLTKQQVYIVVKTAKQNVGRLKVIIDTWFNSSPGKIYFVTDLKDKQGNISTNGHIINTPCLKTHGRDALCCKMSYELESFLPIQQHNKWFCHFDDDNYVNVDRLVRMLSAYDHRELLYLGKNIKTKVGGHATGGAGFCLSNTLIVGILNIIGKGQFLNRCRKYRSPDDVTMAKMIRKELKMGVTHINEFHSHLEGLKDIRESLVDQISLSYKGNNTIKIDGFPVKDDPTRFYSLHCLLHKEECDRLGKVLHTTKTIKK